MNNKWLIIIGLCLASSSCIDIKKTEGELVYDKYCLNCHQDNGEGLAKLIPPLNDKNFLTTNYGSLPCMIKNGINKPVIINNIEYDKPMEGIADIKDVELVNVLNYINEKIAKTDRRYTLKQVQYMLESCKE